MIDIGVITLQEAYVLRVVVNNMIEEHEKSAMDVLMKGDSHPYFALKQGNKKRSWNNTEGMVQLLRDSGYASADIYDIKVKGIPALEKLTKETEIDLEQFIEVSRNKSTLVYTGEKE
tara:strand:+ start:1879 stop:2229 length:351 start_codon:yes stop_codon:yes gene_type:complete